MAEEFLASFDGSSVPPAASMSKGDREPVHLMVVGSPSGIACIINTLHHLGFAEVGAWSKLQPEPNTGKMMRVLTKRITCN